MSTMHRNGGRKTPLLLTLSLPLLIPGRPGSILSRPVFPIPETPSPIPNDYIFFFVPFFGGGSCDRHFSKFVGKSLAVPFGTNRV